LFESVILTSLRDCLQSLGADNPLLPHTHHLPCTFIFPSDQTSFSRRIFHLSFTTSDGEVFRVTVVYIYRVIRTVTRLRAGRRRNRGSIPEFCLLQSVHTGSEDHPTFYTMGTADSFPGAKAMGREVNHSLPSNTDVMSGWSCTSTPSICLHCVHRDIHLYLDTHQRWRG
jgi:hypothetical protein